MKQLALTKGLFATVSDEDFEEVSRYKWSAAKYDRSYGNYAVTWMTTESGRRELVKMHRFIMKAKPGELVDHINRDTLCNLRENLRICTHAQNQANRRLNCNNSTGFKGVRFHKRDELWQAQIQKAGKVTHLGTFATAEDAARAYDAAAIRMFGEFRALNFPSAPSE